MITNSTSGMYEASSHRSGVVKRPAVSMPIIRARGGRRRFWGSPRAVDCGAGDGLTGVEVVDVVESEVGMAGMRSRAKSCPCILCVLWT